MKRFVCILLVVLLTLIYAGCNIEGTNEEKTPITINSPKDDTVNGYRKEDKTFTEKIKTDNITATENTQSYSYFGNKNSKKFHKVSCSSYKNTKKENRVFYKTRNEFISYGYTACKICNP